LELARQALTATDPVLLGLYINFSIFQRDHLHDNAAALALVHEALNEYHVANDERQPVPSHDAEEEIALVGVLQQNAESWGNQVGDD
jgi:hypothetical protein